MNKTGIFLAHHTSHAIPGESNSRLSSPPPSLVAGRDRALCVHADRVRGVGARVDATRHATRRARHATLQRMGEMCATDVAQCDHFGRVALDFARAIRIESGVIHITCIGDG